MMEDVRGLQAGAIGKLCAMAITRALTPWAEWCRHYPPANPIPAVERRKWAEFCDEAEADAVAYARRAASVVLR